MENGRLEEDVSLRIIAGMMRMVGFLLMVFAKVSLKQERTTLDTKSEQVRCKLDVVVRLFAVGGYPYINNKRFTDL